MVTSQGEVLADFSYGDGRDWPLIADGAGHSLVPLIPSDQTGNAMEYGGNWRASTYLDGSPGIADPAPVTTVQLNEIEAHTDYNNPTPPFDQFDSNDGIELYNTTASTIIENLHCVIVENPYRMHFPTPTRAIKHAIENLHSVIVENPYRMHFPTPTRAIDR